MKVRSFLVCSRLLGLYSQASPRAWEHLTFSRRRIVIIAQHLCFVKGFCKVCRLHARNSQSCASPSGGTGKGRNPPAGEKPARRRRTSLTGAGLPTYVYKCLPRERRASGAKTARACEGSCAEGATPPSRTGTVRTVPRARRSCGGTERSCAGVGLLSMRRRAIILLD